MNITEYAMFKKLFGKGGGGSGGDPTPLQEKHMKVAKNGTHIVTPDPGYALSKATVTVAVPEKPAITDVDIFPNPDSGFIDELDKQSTYRLSAGIYAHEIVAKTKQQFGNTHIVDELPEVGEPCTLDGVNINAVYYNRADGTAYAYVSDEIAPALGVPADWYDAGLLLQSLGYTYGGVVTNVGSMTDIGTFYFLANTSYFAYSDEAWVEFAPVVGGGSVIFPCMITIQDQDYCGAYDVTYKTYENGSIVDKQAVVPNGGNVTILAVQGTEMFVTIADNGYSLSGIGFNDNNGTYIDTNDRWADGGAYTTVPALSDCYLIIMG